ncbi:MAG: hypothetical protein CVV05_00470 [Gammaproteobacteria bacterium HGW-Gammaproteobacteria-1]|nr:MAG: hypothetical protein CVV05_00470 [Gammaproteobacteria bacterium HGW-Gammaproteobacteria-1]
MQDSLNEALSKGRVAAAAALIGCSVDLEYRNCLGVTLIEAALEGRRPRGIALVRNVLGVESTYSIEQGAKDVRMMSIAKDAAGTLSQARFWSVALAVEAANLKDPGCITLPMRFVLWEMIPLIEKEMRAGRQWKGPTCRAT